MTIRGETEVDEHQGPSSKIPPGQGSAASEEGQTQCPPLSEPTPTPSGPLLCSLLFKFTQYVASLPALTIWKTTVMKTTTITNTTPQSKTEDEIKMRAIF